MAEMMLGAALLALGAYTAMESVPIKTSKSKRYTPYPSVPRIDPVEIALPDPPPPLTPETISVETPTVSVIEDNDGPAFVGVDPIHYLEARD